LDNTEFVRDLDGEELVEDIKGVEYVESSSGDEVVDISEEENDTIDMFVHEDNLEGDDDEVIDFSEFADDATDKDLCNFDVDETKGVEYVSSSSGNEVDAISEEADDTLDLFAPEDDWLRVDFANNLGGDSRDDDVIIDVSDFEDDDGVIVFSEFEDNATEKDLCNFEVDELTTGSLGGTSGINNELCNAQSGVFFS